MSLGRFFYVDPMICQPLILAVFLLASIMFWEKNLAFFSAGCPEGMFFCIPGRYLVYTVNEIAI